MEISILHHEHGNRFEILTVYLLQSGYILTYIYIYIIYIYIIYTHIIFPFLMVTYRHTQMQPSHLFKLREPVIVGFRRHNGHPNEVSHRKYVVTPTQKKTRWNSC